MFFGADDVGLLLFVLDTVWSSFFWEVMYSLSWTLTCSRATLQSFSSSLAERSCCFSRLILRVFFFLSFFFVPRFAPEAFEAGADPVLADIVLADIVLADIVLADIVLGRRLVEAAVAVAVVAGAAAGAAELDASASSVVVVVVMV